MILKVVVGEPLTFIKYENTCMNLILLGLGIWIFMTQVTIDESRMLGAGETKPAIEFETKFTIMSPA